MAIQFFFSHVAFPARNAAVDDDVTALLEDPILNHDTPGIWLTDIVRPVHRHLYQRWLNNVDDAHTTLCRKTRAPRQGGTLLEANLVPASITSKTQVAALIERWRRLPSTDLWYILIQEPLPPAPMGTGQRPHFTPLDSRHCPHRSGPTITLRSP